jgi:hypothetical protein
MRFNGFILRIKPLFAHAAVAATVITLHPDLLKFDVKSVIMLICFIIVAMNNAVVGRYKEERTDKL